jgi:hypothetical protein
MVGSHRQRKTHVLQCVHLAGGKYV